MIALLKTSYVIQSCGQPIVGFHSKLKKQKWETVVLVKEFHSRVENQYHNYLSGFVK